MKVAGRLSQQTRLTAPVKRLLQILLEDGEITTCERPNYLSGNNFRVLVKQVTVDAAYERGLVALVVDNRRRKIKSFVRLTEIGEHVARDLKNQSIQRDLRFGEIERVSEAAQKLTAELVDAE